MTHQTANMAEVKSGTERFREGIRWIDDPRDMTKDDITIRFPLLNCKMLNINMSGAWCWATRVDHQDCCLVILL